MACDLKFADEDLEVDHVIPRAVGAWGCLCNSQLLCRGCNQRKSAANHEDYRDDFTRERLIAGCTCPGRDSDCRVCRYHRDGVAMPWRVFAHSWRSESD